MAKHKAPLRLTDRGETVMDSLLILGIAGALSAAALFLPALAGA